MKRIILIAALVTGCVASRSPGMDVVRASDVTIHAVGSNVDHCVRIVEVTASDGRFNSTGRMAYEGSYDGAVRKLRKITVTKGGNAVLIIDVLERTSPHCCGWQFDVTGTIMKCTELVQR